MELNKLVVASGNEHKIKEIGKTKEICEKYQQYWIKEE